MARKTKEMSPDQKRQVVRLHQDEFKKTDIGKIIGFSRSAVFKFLKRFDQRENKPRTGRPRSTSKQGEGALIRLVKQDRRRSLRNLMNEFNQSVPVLICKRSIQRGLSKNGFHRRIVAKTLTILLKNRKNHVRWCRNRLHWTIQEEWNKIIFSDEMQVVLGKNSCVYVWQKSKERWNTQCLGLYGSRNGGTRVSVMFWGCICKDGVGTITDVEGNINSAKYMDILDNNLASRCKIRK